MCSDRNYGKTDVTRVTEERYDEMLNVLPPSRWYRGSSMQSFHLCEYVSDGIVLWMVWIVGVGWFSFQDSPTLSITTIYDKVVQFLRAEEKTHA